MPGEFDFNGARAAGYSDDEIADYVRSMNLQPRAALPASIGRMSPANAEAAFQTAKNDTYRFGAYQPAGPESGRFKLRVPRRDAGPTQAEEQYRGLTGIIREYSPAAAAAVDATGRFAGDAAREIDRSGVGYLPEAAAVELAGQKLLWRPGMRLAEIPAGGLKKFVPKGAQLEVADVRLDDAPESAAVGRAV